MTSQLRNMNGPLSYYRTTRIRFEEEQGKCHYSLECIDRSEFSVCSCTITRSSARRTACVAYLGRQRPISDARGAIEDERDDSDI